MCYFMQIILEFNQCSFSYHLLISVSFTLLYKSIYWTVHTHGTVTFINYLAALFNWSFYLNWLNCLEYLKWESCNWTANMACMSNSFFSMVSVLIYWTETIILEFLSLFLQWLAVNKQLRDLVQVTIKNIKHI